MTYETYMAHCPRCRCSRPFEISEEGTRRMCLFCMGVQRKKTEPLDTATRQHIAALDGMGNRGPGAYEVENEKERK